MNTKEIQHNVEAIFDNFVQDEFIYNLLLAYGISKTSITRLRKGDFNLAAGENEVLYKRKIYFKYESSDQLLHAIDVLSKKDEIQKHKIRFTIVTDYRTLVAKDLKTGKTLDIAINELPKYFDFFLPLAGSEVYNSSNDNEADRNAAYKMASLYDLLIEENPNTYNSKEKVHELNVFLSRLLFCFFAEDTEIFEEDSIFTNSLAQHTSENGNDVHLFLNELFKRLNDKNGNKYPAYLAKFPYVNGGLFKNRIDSPRFNAKARRVLIELGELQWREINPDIFGSMIQAVVIPEYRSNLGMHYTSVPNILKLIRPLFLDELYEEMEKSNSVKQLKQLIQRISKIKFFDPACGSGNFLIITYKELRVLEIEIIKKIIDLSPNQIEIHYSQIQLSQFYGIEIDDFAHEMAILSLWLAEHQMNKVFEDRLLENGRSLPILPLKNAGQIIQGNATRLDWNNICKKTDTDEVYIIGNPPYQGYSKQSSVQREDMKIAFSGLNNYKKLDYIFTWFYKASNYIHKSRSKFSFVSTNSICQGEQVALFWPLIFEKNQEIFYAHKSFKWSNNAKGSAGVTVVILGIMNANQEKKYIFENGLCRNVKNINPYLIDFKNLLISSSRKQLSNAPDMIIGSKLSDNGYLLLDEDEKRNIEAKHPKINKLIKRYIGADEFLNGKVRYCIHVTEDNVDLAYSFEILKNRFKHVKEFRAESKKVATKKKANTPHFFDEDKHRNSDFLLFPQTTSESREYIPVGFFSSDYVPSNGTRVVYNSEPWLFSILSSKMHMIWVHIAAGRLETRIQYSNTICYNTFPFPKVDYKAKANLSVYAFSILDIRAKYANRTLAELYDSSEMPNDLRDAHIELDEAVDKYYRVRPFSNNTERLEYLLGLYEQLLLEQNNF